MGCKVVSVDISCNDTRSVYVMSLCCRYLQRRLSMFAAGVLLYV
jgi:hypothetical protein